MVPANTYQNILTHLDNSHEPGVWMCGLLFAPPNSSIGQSIMQRLDDWQHRSGENIDFYCVGYVDYKEFDDDEPVGRLTELDGSEACEFFYSAKFFNDVCNNVKALSRWSYSGEADLLLVNAVQPDSGDYPRTYLDFDEFIALDIDKMISEKVFGSVSRLMERVCDSAASAAQQGEPIKVQDFANKERKRTLFRRTLHAFLEKLKLDTPLGARHFIAGAHLLEPA